MANQLEAGERVSPTPPSQREEIEEITTSVVLGPGSCLCHKGKEETEKLLGQYQDLITADFRPWFRNAVYELGCREFDVLATQARRASAPARYFSTLIKLALSGTVVAIKSQGNDMAQIKCKAGFVHNDGDICNHVLAAPMGAPAVPIVTRKYEGFMPDDFYSDEATAKRRAENKIKYAPTGFRGRR